MRIIYLALSSVVVVSLTGCRHVPFTGASSGMAPPRPALSGAFPIRGYHQHVFLDQLEISEFKKRLDFLAELDYNLVVFGMGHPGKSAVMLKQDGTLDVPGGSPEAFADLIRYAQDRGLEPVFELKYVGKQKPVAQHFLEAHPEVCLGKDKRAGWILNPNYRFADGRDAYDAIAFATIDRILDLYPAEHPPKYFLLGVDEFSTDVLAQAAQVAGCSVQEMFARLLDRASEHLATRGVTAVIWGDTLLSPNLGTKEHGIEIPGYRPDPRLEEKMGGAFHANFFSDSTLALHTTVNHMKHRADIIVADWHYHSHESGEYPSVDYFLKVGFKDVWGAPWFGPDNIRDFPKYAAGCGAGGMLATAWNVAYAPTLRMRLWRLMINSAYHFKKPYAPAFPAPEALRYTVTGANPGTVGNEAHMSIVINGDASPRITIPTSLSRRPAKALILLTAQRGRGLKTCTPEWDEASKTFSADLSPTEGMQVKPGLTYGIRFGYQMDPEGPVVTYDPAGMLAFVDTPPPASVHEAAPGVLLDADFATLSDTRKPRGMWLRGECFGGLGAASPRKSKGKPRTGALDCAWYDRAWYLTPAYLDRKICEHGFRVELDIKCTGSFEGNDYSAIFTKGSYTQGFRILMRQDRAVLFQLARLADGGTPVYLHTDEPLPMDTWMQLVCTYRPPTASSPGTMGVEMNGKEVGKVSVTKAMEPSVAPIGFGCEFKNALDGPHGKLRPNFPGLMRRATLSVAE